MSYQGLDTENQRLQKALENSSKKIQQLEAELQEVETENQMLQRNLEELKISSKRLEQLEQEVRKNKEKCSFFGLFSGTEQVQHHMTDSCRWFCVTASATYFWIGLILPDRMRSVTKSLVEAD